VLLGMSDLEIFPEEDYIRDKQYFESLKNDIPDSLRFSSLRILSNCPKRLNFFGKYSCERITIICTLKIRKKGSQKLDYCSVTPDQHAGFLPNIACLEVFGAKKALNSNSFLETFIELVHWNT